MKRKVDQMELRMPAPKYKWGGGRPGAGRKESKYRKGLPHRRRPFHEKEQPVHITWRGQGTLPSLRRFDIAAVIGEAFRAAMQDHEKRGTSFRVIHFSIQPNHLHLMIEAENKT